MGMLLSNDMLMTEVSFRRKLETSKTVLLQIQKPVHRQPNRILPRTRAQAAVRWCRKVLLNRDVGLSTEVISKEYGLLRERREFDIMTGSSYRVHPTKEPRMQVVQPVSEHVDDLEALDPIQRAGRRLLSKAAIPIQSTARRFLAQREAVDRMWALLEIQSYVRRWRAEAYLLASVISAVTIQTVFRGARCRKLLKNCIDAATHIQRVVRGYLAAVHTYEIVYRIILVQAQDRGWVTRFRFRRHIARIQTWWRAQMLSQFLLVDTIIAQTAARRWIARY